MTTPDSLETSILARLPTTSSRQQLAARRQLFQQHALSLSDQLLPAVQLACRKMLQQTVGATRVTPVMTSRSDGLARTQADELAQLLMSSWCSVLTNACEESARVDLDELGWPVNVPEEERSEGVLAFPLPVGQAMHALREYAEGLLANHSAALLTPTLRLSVSGQGKWHVETCPWPSPDPVESPDISGVQQRRPSGC